MTQFSVQLPGRGTIDLDLDLQTTTVASVKATVDAHLESLWRASGVRILRSDLPFRGITLKYRNRLLAMDRVLSSCRIRKGSTLHAQPQKSEKEERRKQYANERRTKDERKLRREKDAARPARQRNSEVLANTTHSTIPETSGDEQTSNMYVSGDRPGEETEVDAQGDDANAGARDLGGEVAHEEQDDQQAEEQGHEERVTREVEQDDPFADEDDNKENRDPMIAPVVQIRANEDRAENLSLFDERNSGRGVDLLEEVLEF